jgi:hypothetical protein
MTGIWFWLGRGRDDGSFAAIIPSPTSYHQPPVILSEMKWSEESASLNLMVVNINNHNRFTILDIVHYLIKPI